ncbi:MAG: hypothetical protein A2Z17_02160 [Gammaproteobacteria bacterium RBG_16_66_13]|nr:MAG: hypothetical protein A2Z17_02160 [Gammaproteobacteria bacterium RBG_16_66_13]
MVQPETPPIEALGRWVPAAPQGRALDLGAGDGAISLWLGRQGFLVDAVENDWPLAKALGRIRRGLPVVVHPIDLRQFPLIANTYSLIVASAVLHFLRPSELWTVADGLSAALVPSGLLIAEVLTTDDPEAVGFRSSGTAQVEPNTYRAGTPEGVIHFFEPGELRRVFHALEVREYDEFRRITPESPGEYRSGATLVGRRPE